MHDQEQVLNARRAARAVRAQKDEAVLEMHRRAVAALGDPATEDDARVEALITLRYWEDNGLSDAENIETWRHILEMRDNEAAALAILDPGEAGARLRRNSPFGPSALRYAG